MARRLLWRMLELAAKVELKLIVYPYVILISKTVFFASKEKHVLFKS
jgi:hypothetical protein